MGKRIRLFAQILLLCAFVVPAMAQHVSEQTAMERAYAFLQKPTSPAIHKAPRKAPRLKAAVTRNEFYIFNDEANPGFVIVSAEERAPEILAFSEERNFDASNIPDNAKAWLEGYAEQIQAIAASKVQKVEAFSTRERIDPLLKTQWDQGYPYNLQTPTYNDEHCVTGCVATAMAQVMNFWKYPQQTIAKIPNTAPSNLTYTRGPIPAGTPINWSKIVTDYRNATTTDAQEQAVADLMLFCGLSVSMGYGISSSGAYSSNVGPALTRYFGYTDGYKLLSRDACSNYDDWQYILYNELRQKHPIYFSASNGEGGHAFVVDGYAQADFFHFNFGWSGSADAFYRVELANGWNQGQDALLGTQPSGMGPSAAPLAVKEIRVNKMTYTRSSASDNFTGVSITSHLFMTDAEDGDIEYAIALEQGGEICSIQNIASNNLQVGDIRALSASLSFGENISNGIYLLVPVCRRSGTTEWQHDIDADKVYVRATIEGNILTLYDGSPYNITATADPVEGGTTTGTGSYKEGTEVQLTAIPAEGYEFVNWTENGNVVSTDANYTFNAMREYDLVAHFKWIGCMVTYQIRYAGKVVAVAQEKALPGAALPDIPASLDNGLITFSKYGTHPTIVTEDVTVIFDAIWKGPFQFTQSPDNAIWHVMHIRNGYYVAKQDAEPYKPAKVDEQTQANPEYHWAFCGDPYHIKVYNKTTGFNETLALDGDNIVMRPGDYTWDIFANGNGFNLRVPGTKSTCVFHYFGKKGLTFWDDESTLTHSAARFQTALAPNSGPSRYSITATAIPAEGGTVTGSGIFEEGASATLTFTAAEDYELESVTVNGIDMTDNITDGVLTFTDIKESKTVVATFHTTCAVITLSADGESTYCYDHDLDFTRAGNIRAYFASGYYPQTGYVLLTRVLEVPAGTGFVVKGEEGTYKVPHGKSSAYYLNLLVGNVEPKTIEPIENGYANLFLTMGDDGLGFYHFTTPFEQKANSARLQLPSRLVVSESCVKIAYEEDADAIHSALDTSDGTIVYDLSGRQLVNGKLTRGIYIRNGKKVAVK